MGDDPGSQGAARAAQARAARWRGDRHRLRPVGADRARGRAPARQARRGVRRRRARVPRVSPAPALGARRGGVAAARRAGRVHRDARSGRQREHHVARRHRDRDRGDGRCGDRDGRECAQEARGVEARARRRAVERRALAGDRGGCGRGRPGALLQPADHHVVVRPGVHARGAGGPAVRAARLYEDLRDGGGGGPRRDARPGADGLFRARPHSVRGGESPQSMADRRIPPCARRGTRLAEDDARRGGPRAGGHRVARARARRRIHAADGRGRSAVHADRAAGIVGGQGGRIAPADRPPHQDGPRSRERVRQGGPRRVGDRSRADGDDRDDDPVQAEIRVAAWHDDGEARRGARSHGARAGVVEHLGAADTQPDRHARDRHQEPGRREGVRPGSRRDRSRDAGDRARGTGASRASRRRSPSGWKAGATSISSSTAAPPRVTGSTSPTCRT